MNFYDILFQQQNAEKVPYSKSYFDTLFAQKFSNVKTLTGTLPLTFTTSETKLRSWVIYGADIEHEKTATGKSISFYTDEDKLRDWTIYGNDDVGKNKLEITAKSTTKNGVTFTVDKQSGTITLNGDTSQQTGGFSFIVAERTDLDGTYLLSGCADGGSSTSYDLYMYDEFDQRFSNRCYDSDDVATFNCVAGHSTKIYIQCRKNYNYDNVVFRPMLRLPDTSADFEPYQQGIGKKTENGYIVPVQSGGVTTNVFVGSDPLTAGESVSKTSTGVDIPTTADATNVVQTPLFYNQPTIEIEYSYTGIGERTLNMLDLRAYRTPVDTGVIVEEVNIDRGVLKFSLDSHSTGGNGLAFEGIPFENGKRYVIDLWNNGTMSTWNPSIRLRRRDTGADIANVGGEFYQVGTNAFFFTYDESLAPEGAYLYIGTGMDKIVDVRSFYIAECPEGESRHFEPFGYQVPFKADQTGQMISYITKVYIGTEPLKAGESVSNTKDARTHIGENTISTMLTDPVTMKIKYKE